MVRPYIGSEYLWNRKENCKMLSSDLNLIFMESVTACYPAGKLENAFFSW